MKTLSELQNEKEKWKKRNKRKREIPRRESTNSRLEYISSKIEQNGRTKNVEMR